MIELEYKFNRYRRRQLDKIVLRVAGKFVGELELVRDFDDKVTLGIAQLWVNKKHRRKGYGGLLVRRAQAYAQRRGLKMWLRAVHDYDAMNRCDLLAFYEGLGFRCTTIFGKTSWGTFMLWKPVQK